jgi:hypothetical protein
VAFFLKGLVGLAAIVALLVGLGALAVGSTALGVVLTGGAMSYILWEKWSRAA